MSNIIKLKVRDCPQCDGGCEIRFGYCEMCGNRGKVEYCTLCNKPVEFDQRKLCNQNNVCTCDATKMGFDHADAGHGHVERTDALIDPIGFMEEMDGREEIAKAADVAVKEAEKHNASVVRAIETCLDYSSHIRIGLACSMEESRDRFAKSLYGLNLPEETVNRLVEMVDERTAR